MNPCKGLYKSTFQLKSRLGYLSKIGKTFELLDDPDVIMILIQISGSKTIRTLELQRKSGISKDATFYELLRRLEDAGLIKKKTNENRSVEYSVTGLYNVMRIDKWIDGTFAGQFEGDFFKNLIMRLKLEYEQNGNA